jgi:hypothetical protein
MNNSTPDTKDVAPRRSFFGHMGGAISWSCVEIIARASARRAS